MSFAAIALGGMAIGTGIKIMGQRQQYKAEVAAHKYNAIAAERNAELERRASLEEQLIHRDQARAYLKEMRGEMAKGGFQPALPVLLKASQNMAEDIAAAAMERMYRIEGLTAEAQMERYYAKAARQAGRLGVLGTLFGGAGQVGKFGWQYKQTTGESLFTKKALFG